MTNYATIPDEVQPAAKTSWRRAVAVAAAASFVLGTFALRTATPARAWADDTCGAGACYDALVAWSLCTQNIYDCYKCSEHIQKIEGVFTLVFDPPEINGGIDCGFLCPATDGPPVPSFVDDQDEDEPEDQSEDQDADADEPEDQDEDQSEGD